MEAVARPYLEYLVSIAQNHPGFGLTPSECQLLHVLLLGRFLGDVGRDEAADYAIAFAEAAKRRRETGAPWKQ